MRTQWPVHTSMSSWRVRVPGESGYASAAFQSLSLTWCRGQEREDFSVLTTYGRGALGCCGVLDLL